MSAPGRRVISTPSTPGRGVPFCCSWSGGKDSCLALHRAAATGAQPRALVTVFTEDNVRTRSHGLHRRVVEAQARELGLPLAGVATSWRHYEENLVGALREAGDEGIEAVVFGDIDIDSHRTWELRVARSAGLVGHLPLWGSDRRRILEEWWELGFEARIVAVRDGVVPTAFLGRVLDAALADSLERLGVDACGENGEFHTVAVDGPPFHNSLALSLGRRVKREDCWFLDVSVDANN